MSPLHDCVFCERIKAKEYDYILRGAVIFAPLNPVVPGHRLIVPVRHVEDALYAPDVTAQTMEVAAIYGRQQRYDCNLITSVGKRATQTVRHLHVHYVPRFDNDALFLPWTDQAERQRYQEIRVRSYDQIRAEVLDAERPHHL